VISQTAEYALRAMVHLASCSLDTGSQTTQQIAEATHVPVGYLSKVLQALNRGGLLTSQRGLGGGFSLNRAPETITVYEIVQEIAPVQRIHTCPLGLEAHQTQLCPLHRKLDQIAAQLEEAYRETTLAMLLDGNPTVFSQAIPSSEPQCRALGLP
jgi:Rrf2 family nitric oxide-sensitive transcriptional repressor